MRSIKCLVCLVAVVGSLSTSLTVTFAAEQVIESAPGKNSLTFRGVDYEHRWSKGGQHEFTPSGQSDLTAWLDMITINMVEDVSNGEQLALLANRVLSAYQRAGKVLRTDSRPRTPDRPAEHLAVVVLGTPKFLEAVFARFVLNDGVGTAVLYARRVYGSPAGQEMGEWLRANGQQVEQALMAWDRIPAPPALRLLPQSN